MKKEDEKKIIFRLPRILADQFKALCVLEGISQNDMLSQLVNNFMMEKPKIEIDQVRNVFQELNIKKG